MSKLQLRSKRRTASPSDSKGQATEEAPSVKRFKKNRHVGTSDSESSSDEFARPPNALKVNPNGIPQRSGPSPEPDFASIEKSIFSGVSRLSESDSNESDFEEVTSTPSAVSKSCAKNAIQISAEKKKTEKQASTNLRSSRRSLVRGKTDDSAVKSSPKEASKDAKPQSSLSTKGVARTSKRKPPEDSEICKKLPRGQKISEEKSMPGNSKNKPQSSKTKKPPEKAQLSGPTRGKNDRKGEPSAVKEEKPDCVDNMDIAQLLALGEGLTMETKSSEPSDSNDEEWEEVDPNDIKKHEFPKEGVQITVQAPEFSWRRKKQRDQQACLQAEMNRAFNRVRRELQLLCHKTSLLLWVAHGIYLNTVINSDSVKATALSLVPCDLATLPKAPGKKYLDQLLKWFITEFECSEGFPDAVGNNQSCSLESVLEQHFRRRYAKSIKELTFMFVSLLRAVGMESRLIISFQPMPLKPLSEELLSVNSKSKKGRRPKIEPKMEEESEDDPSPKVVKTSEYFNSKGKTASKSKEQTATVKRGGTRGDTKPAASKEISSKKDENSKTKRGNAPKSEPSSPLKSRQLRGKNTRKVYKEHSNSDETSDEEENSKPILSPDRKGADDTSLAARLKAAAAKRIPGSKRRQELSKKSPKSSQSPEKSNKESGSKSKRSSQARGSNKSLASQKPSTSRRSQVQQSDSEDSDFEIKPKSRSSSQKPSTSRRSRSQTSNSDSDFETKPKSKQTQSGGKKSKTPTKGRRSKGDSTKDDDSSKTQVSSSGSDYWVEVYLKDEEKWVCVDVSSKKVDSTAVILAKATQPVCYVMAFNLEGTIKDVTKRYAPKFSQVTTKQRVSADWWDKSLRGFKPKQTKREVAEDSEMNLVELDRPMPKSVGECKNHPLYVLKRHLLKFEAIYPPDSPSLGFVRNEAIYARQNVYTLHSREIWIKEAKVVKPGEEPYKIVKARPKWDRLSGKVISDLPLEVFGPWQVEDYVPPPAVDGKIPRNAYGNVELFKPSMLPKGCVHLQVPGLSRVAKKLQMDCAPAVVGFDYHSGGSHPTFDGFVVCEENVDVLMDAWNREIDESAKRREEKHEKRVYGNWRRLIRGLLIREQLKYRYDFKEEGQEDAGSSQSTVNADVLKASRITAENAPLPSLFPKLMAKIRNQKKSHQRKSSSAQKKNPTSSKVKKQNQKPQSRKKRKDETSDEEESEWDSSTTEEDESEMVLLSDEDSGSDFEDLKK